MHETHLCLWIFLGKGDGAQAPKTSMCRHLKDSNTSLLLPEN